MKNGRDRGFIYWKLNYRKKFIRTLWMIPFGIFAIFLAVISGVSVERTVLFTLAIIITLVAQLFYTYHKWKNELQSH